MTISAKPPDIVNAGVREIAQRAIGRSAESDPEAYIAARGRRYVQRHMLFAAIPFHPLRPAVAPTIGCIHAEAGEQCPRAIERPAGQIADSKAFARRFCRHISSLVSRDYTHA